MVYIYTYIYVCVYTHTHISWSRKKPTVLDLYRQRRKPLQSGYKQHFSVAVITQCVLWRHKLRCFGALLKQHIDFTHCWGGNCVTRYCSQPFAKRVLHNTLWDKWTSAWNMGSIFSVHSIKCLAERLRLRMMDTAREGGKKKDWNRGWNAQNVGGEARRKEAGTKAWREKDSQSGKEWEESRKKHKKTIQCGGFYS